MRNEYVSTGHCVAGGSRLLCPLCHLHYWEEKWEGCPKLCSLKEISPSSTCAAQPGVQEETEEQVHMAHLPELGGPLSLGAAVSWHSAQGFPSNTEASARPVCSFSFQMLIPIVYQFLLQILRPLSLGKTVPT